MTHLSCLNLKGGGIEDKPKTRARITGREQNLNLQASAVLYKKRPSIIDKMMRGCGRKEKTMGRTQNDLSSATVSDEMGWLKSSVGCLYSDKPMTGRFR